MKETERMYLCLSQERIIQFQVSRGILCTLKSHIFLCHAFSHMALSSRLSFILTFSNGRKLKENPGEGRGVRVRNSANN